MPLLTSLSRMWLLSHLQQLWHSHCKLSAVCSASSNTTPCRWSCVHACTGGCTHASCWGGASTQCIHVSLHVGMQPSPARACTQPTHMHAANRLSWMHELVCSSVGSQPCCSTSPWDPTAPSDATAHSALALPHLPYSHLSRPQTDTVPRAADAHARHKPRRHTSRLPSWLGCRCAAGVLQEMSSGCDTFLTEVARLLGCVAHASACCAAEEEHGRAPLHRGVAPRRQRRAAGLRNAPLGPRGDGPTQRRFFADIDTSRSRFVLLTAQYAGPGSADRGRNAVRIWRASRCSGVVGRRGVGCAGCRDAGRHSTGCQQANLGFATSHPT